MSAAKNKQVLEKLGGLENIVMSEEVKNYILNHPNSKVAAKIVRNIMLLNEFGFDLPLSFIHKIRTSKEKLWELRTVFSNNAERTLFFAIYQGKFLLTNCFSKSSDDIPKNEILKAERILHEYIVSIEDSNQ